MAKPTSSKENRYKALIEGIFFDHWRKGATEFEFERVEIKRKADKLNIALPDNIGDVIYSIRYRSPLPTKVLGTQPKGQEWIIEGAGRSRYRFKLVSATRIKPRADLVRTAIPDATPELIRAYALDDEQALLAIVRYNRLIDTFLGLTTYSLQNHLRTTVTGIGQIEIDELYVGIDKHGCHYVIPVQAKGGKDQIGVVQTTQDIKFVEQKFPGMRCRAISAQFMDGGAVALFELTLKGGQVKVVDERHYELVPADQLDQKAIRNYRT
ncbi:MAG: endonuclease [Parvibaculum sp.]|nr:endonuclease [Parvibaculum sp.]